jgi:sarcosine oxidase subunit beta
MLGAVRSAAVVVVGGGVMGASVAWHLAALGERDVLVLERGLTPGLGSTGRATGGFRAQFGSEINVRLSLLAREKLLRFGEETGVDPGYVCAGYLWLAGSEAELGALRAALAVQHAAGLDEAVEIGAAEIAQLNRWISLDGVFGASYCPTDGFIKPLAILQGYLAAATRLGVRLEPGIEVTALRRDPNGRVITVETTAGPIRAGAVVNAAGPWAAEVAAMAGVQLPVMPLRRQVAATAPCDLLPADMPMTIWAGDGFHLRVRDGRVLLLRPTPGAAGRPFDVSLEDDWIDAVRTTACDRVPALRGVAVERAACWAGLYEVSPDKHAILGAAPGCENLYFINGSSGHGVMHAPALGQLLAELMCYGRAVTLDPTPLGPSRFERGEAITGSELL